MEIYHKRKQGITIAAFAKKYRISKSRVDYLIHLLNKHCQKILRDDNNTYYSPVLKQEIINKVLIEHRSITKIAIEHGLSSKRILGNWIKFYEEILKLRAENEYLKKLRAAVQARKGRQPKKK